MSQARSITHAEIARRAREIWEQCGRPSGADVEHWLRAERELRESAGAPTLGRTEPLPNAASETAGDWRSIAEPPEPYDVALLRFEDGSQRQGAWTGKLWWGYDERVRRSCQLYPDAWRPLSARVTAATRPSKPSPSNGAAAG